MSITTTLHEIEERCGVIEVYAGLQAIFSICRELH